MSIPNYQAMMLPLLRFVGDRREHSLREAIDAVAVALGQTAEERKQLLPSGQPVFDNRVGWARTYMKKAGLIEYGRRGYFRITDRGLSVLAQNPVRVDRKLLEQYDEFREFVTGSRSKVARNETLGEASKTPEDILADAYQSLRNNLAEELIQQVKASPPSLFESIVVRLLVEMGYGGSLKDAGEAVGGTGDEGIDGIIKEDRLGLDIIYVQAKRWQSTVGRPEIQKFAGALQGQRARKGVFITTSDFSQDARDYASRIDSKIILIDGNQLAELMIDYNIGVSTQATYLVRKVDLDYFTEQ